MAKDPAFLFYPGDWLGGTLLFSRSHKGAYMDLLMAQYANGHLSIDEIRGVLNGDFESMWESRLSAKFKVDDKGLYFNEKLDEVLAGRRLFTASRLSNLKGNSKKKNTHTGTHMETHMETHMGGHMENENENENIIFKVSKEKKEKTTIKKNSTKVQSEKSIEIIEYLNELNGTNFRTDTKATVRLIDQRIGEGYSIQELKEIIEYKIAEWKGTEWDRFLQPDTLFNGEKCAKYRNQVQAAKDKGLTANQIKGKNGKTSLDKDEVMRMAFESVNKK